MQGSVRFTKHLTVFKRLSNAAVALSLLSTIAMPLVPKVSAAITIGARVSFTFDDGLQSDYTLAAPTLAKYGYTGTAYISSGCIGMVTVPNTCRADTTVPYMTWAQASDLHTTYKWELGAHTVNHVLLASTDPTDQPVVLTAAEVVSELADSKTAIKANTGVDPVAMATPFGDYNQSTLNQIAKLYSSHRGFADVGYNGFPNNDYLLYDQQVQAGSTAESVPVVTLDMVKGYIDTAKLNNQWLVLTFHNIVASGATEYATNNSDLDAIAAYVKSVNVPVVNVSDGIVTGTNLLPNGSFDTALSSDIAQTTAWSTDDPTNIKQDTGDNGSFPSSTNSILLNSTTKNNELFSPRVAVSSTDKYVIKSFLDVAQITVGTGHEIDFYVDEYDANGVYLQTQFKKAEPTLFTESLNFEYVPTNATVKAARLQVVTLANSGLKAYLDNVQWISETAVPGGLGAGSKAGDVDGNGVVNALDLSVLAKNWQAKNATRAQGDLDGNGVVNALDLSILANNWGK